MCCCFGGSSWPAARSKKKLRKGKSVPPPATCSADSTERYRRGIRHQPGDREEAPRTRRDEGQHSQSREGTPAREAGKRPRELGIRRKGSRASGRRKKPREKGKRRRGRTTTGRGRRKEEKEERSERSGGGHLQP